MSDCFQISSHGIYFLSDEILKTSHKNEILWEETEKALESVQFFVGGLILNSNEKH